MRTGSGVKTRIIARGTISAPAAKSTVTATEKRRAMPWTAPMARISPLPKYWALSMVTPVPRP